MALHFTSAQIGKQHNAGITRDAGMAIYTYAIIVISYLTAQQYAPHV